MTEDADRLAFGRMLKGQAEFLKIREDSKAPVGSFRPGRRNRYKRMPKLGNYGILPGGRLVILDVDINKGGSVEEQTQLFSAFLCVDLTKTVTVRTPSGGLHFYLRLPLSTHSVKDLPKTNLRSFQAEISELTGTETVVDADIRSEAANAYIVGPWSSIGEDHYTLIQGKEILEIGEQGFANLVKLKALKAEKKKAKREELSIDLWADEPLAADAPISSKTPNTKSLQKIERALKSRNYMTYHQQRAFVKAALHCCYSNDAIVLACIALGVNKDSASSNAINRYALQKDIHSFSPEDRFHGPYCPVGMDKVKGRKPKLSEEDFQTYLARMLERRKIKQTIPSEKTFHKVSPRVLDTERISKRLIEQSKRGAKTKQYAAAMMIVESVLQPLSNVGADKILLSRSFLAQELPLSPSQIAQALRVLREAGVLEVRDRQKQGFAPTYVVHPEFVHRKLTFHLKRTWVELNKKGLSHSLVFSAVDGGFLTAVQREPVFTNSLAAAIAEHHAEVLASAEVQPVVTSAVNSYLKSENSSS